MTLIQAWIYQVFLQIQVNYINASKSKENPNEYTITTLARKAGHVITDMLTNTTLKTSKVLSAETFILNLKKWADNLDLKDITEQNIVEKMNSFKGIILKKIQEEIDVVKKLRDDSGHPGSGVYDDLLTLCLNTLKDRLNDFSQYYFFYFQHRSQNQDKKLIAAHDIVSQVNNLKIYLIDISLDLEFQKLSLSHKHELKELFFKTLEDLHYKLNTDHRYLRIALENFSKGLQLLEPDPNAFNTIAISMCNPYD